MIISIDISKLRNAEYFQFMQNVIQATAKNDPVAMKVEGPFNDLKNVAGELEDLFKLPAGSAITAEIENLDIQRDNALKGIQGIVRACIFSEDAVIKKHALVLDNHLAVYGSNIVAESYQSETAIISNIITDWNEKPELTAAMAALGLQQWQKNLDTANYNFNEKYMARAEEVGTDSTESYKAKRLEANSAYYALRDDINAHYTLTRGSEPYKKVVSLINGLAVFYNDVLNRRVGSTEEPDAPAGDKPVETK